MANRSLVIFRRELVSYFLSPIAYVFGVLFLTVLLFLSAQSTLVHNAQASMQAFFLYLPWIYLIFLPGLTMRLWAEERKLGTIELLLTFPVRPGQVVLGKFLAVLTYLAFVLLLLQIADGVEGAGLVEEDPDLTSPPRGRLRGAAARKMHDRHAERPIAGLEVGDDDVLVT